MRSGVQNPIITLARSAGVDQGRFSILDTLYCSLTVAGAVATLALPQDISSGASPTFASITVSNTPSAATDATNKSYVDAATHVLGVHQSVKVAINTSKNTSNPNGSLFDGVTLSVGDRLLLTAQLTASQNGIWIFNGPSSAMTRPSDFNGTVGGATATDWSGTLVYVSQGSTFADTFFVLTTNNPVTINTTAQTWTQYGYYAGGTGITVSGSTISISASYVGQTSITTLGTITTGTWNGSAINLSTYATGVLPAAHGGTGIANSGTITLGGNLMTSGAFNTTLTVTANTNVTLPTSGTLVNTAVTALTSLASVGTITSGTWQGTAVTATHGGTGLTSYTTGDLIVATGTNSLGHLVAGSNPDGSVLTLSGGIPTWSTGAYGNPTALIGLTAVNGTASTAMRSDAAPALDQSISPTWTGDHTFDNPIVRSVNTAVAAAGTTQGAATALANDFNVVTSATVSTNTAVKLPATVAGLEIKIFNTTAVDLSVFPPNSSAINALGTNAAFTLPAGACIAFCATSSTQWYTLNATYA